MSLVVGAVFSGLHIGTLARDCRKCTIAHVNMHVGSGDLLPWASRAREITDEQVEQGKAKHRGLILEQLLYTLSRCDEHDGDDPRYLEIRLRTLDRLARLTRVYEPQSAEKGAQGDLDRARLVDAAAATLDALEAKLRAAGGSGGRGA